jgi:hypothetical protein
MPILVAIVCFALAACMVIETGTPPSAPLPKLTVYVWVGPGPAPSVDRLAQDKVACVHETEKKVSTSEVDRWQTHMNHCMETKGWGQKAVD